MGAGFDARLLIAYFGASAAIYLAAFLLSATAFGGGRADGAQDPAGAAWSISRR